jgi:hypothetical protein
MRGSWLWVALAACAGCDDGIYIEVQAPPGMQLDRVELIVGDRACKLGADGQRECNGVQPPGFTEHLGKIGDVYFRDDETRDYTATVSGGSAFFQLQPGEGMLQIVAIGTSNQTVTAAAVLIEIDLSKHPVRYVAPLLPAEDLTSPPSEDGAAGVQIWRTPTDQIACVAVDDHHTSRGPVFIVPESDPDCDGIALQPECDPLGHLTPGFAPDPTEAQCVAPFKTDTVTGLTACMLGGPACSEQPASRSTCGTTNYCVPSTVCSQCMASFDQACATQALTAETTPRVRCGFGVEQDVNGDFVACANTEPRALVDLTSAVTRACSGAPLLSPLDQLAFAQTLDIDVNGHTFKLAPHLQTGLCAFDIAWDGFADPSLVGIDNVTPAHALLDLTFPPTAQAPTHDMLLPLEVQFVEDCNTFQNTCVLDPNTPDDTVFNCGR